MIRSNLSILLAERGLKITKVAKETGISRTTLTALSNNYGQGIQFDTLNTLCMYLKVTPNQLLSFVPVDIRPYLCEMEFYNNGEWPNNCRLKVNLFDGSRKYSYEMIGDIFYSVLKQEIFSADIEFVLFDPDLDNPSDDVSYRKYLEEVNLRLIRVFSQLSDPFLADLEEDISEMAFDALLKAVESENNGYSVNKECLIKVKFSDELRGKK